MRYRLAHSKEIKRNRWNKICPICKQPKFSPYIDTVTNEPIAAKECGRCCREKSCAYQRVVQGTPDRETRVVAT